MAGQMVDLRAGSKVVRSVGTMAVPTVEMMAQWRVGCSVDHLVELRVD